MRRHISSLVQGLFTGFALLAVVAALAGCHQAQAAPDPEPEQVGAPAIGPVSVPSAAG